MMNRFRSGVMKVMKQTDKRSRRAVCCFHHHSQSSQSSSSQSASQIITGCIISVIGVAPHNAQQLWRWQARNQALRSVSLKFRIDPQNDRKQHSQCSVSAVSDRHCSAQNNVQFFQTLHSFRDDRILGQHDFTNFRPLVSGFEPHDGSCMCSMRMF